MISFNDLKNVALWDMTVHRGEYRRKCLAVAIFYGVLMLIHIVPQICQLITFGSGNISPEIFYAEDIAYSMILFKLSFVVYILLMGHMFKILVTKQGRINEFMLPADNLTRFTWRVIVTVVGTAVMLIAGIVCYDLLQMLVHWIALKDYDVQSVFVMYDVTSDVLAQIRKTFDDVTLWFFFDLMGVLGLVFMGSTYALGSSIKYKKSILWTTLFHFLLSVVGIVLLLIFAVNIADSGLMTSIFRYLDKNTDVEWLKDNVWVIFFVFCLIEACVIGLLWRITYRMYCKAQLTTRINP